MKNTKIGLLIISIIVVATIAYGFILSGSPATQRKRQLDQRRLEYLDQISQEVQSRYRLTNSLPVDLSALSGTSRPAATETFSLADLSYKILGADSYELCATFETERQGAKKALYEPGWEVRQAPHRAGLECYTFQMAK